MISANTHHVATLQALDATTNAHPHIAQFGDTARADLLFGEADVSRLAEAAIERWNVMLDAGLSKYMPTDSAPVVAPPARSDELNMKVCECVDALCRLHATPNDERETHRAVEWHALATSQIDRRDAEAGAPRARPLAMPEGLTALPNRSLFRWQLERALEQVIEQRRSLAVICLHLDGFKPTNDECGHDAEDELLKIVAARITHALRTDDTVGRTGGNEFACLMANVQSRGRLSHLARTLFNAVVAPLMIGQQGVTVAPSLGIARFPVDGATVDELLEKAGAAMLEAKRKQSGYAFFLKQRDGFSLSTSRPSQSVQAHHAI